MPDSSQDFKNQNNKKRNEIDEIRSMMLSNSSPEDADDRENILLNISQAFMDKSSEEERQESLSQFVSLKSTGKPENYLKAIKEFGADSLGKENWLIGLVGILYDKNMTDSTVMDSLITNLIDHLEDKDVFFVRSIMKGILSRAEDIPEKTRKTLINFLMKPKYRSYLQKYQGQYVGEELRDMIASLFDQIADQNQKYKFLEELALNGISSKKQVNLTPIKHSAFATKAKQKIYLDKLDDQPHSLITTSSQSGRTVAKTAKRTIIISPTTHHIPLSIPNVVFTPISNNAAKKELSDSIKSILKMGFEQVILIFPNIELFSLSDLASELTRDFGQSIVIINSKTVGLALRRLIEECSRCIVNQKPTQDISAVVQKISTTSNYWIIPKNNLSIRKTIWYSNIPTESNKFDLHKIPLIRFNKDQCTFKNKSLFSDSIQDALNEIRLDFTNAGHIPLEVILEYSAGTKADVSSVQTKLQRLLPSNRILVIYSDAQNQIEIGDYIGIYLR